MLDHISFGVSDFARSTPFHDHVVAPLGISRLFNVPEEQSGGVKVTVYGDYHPWSWLANENPKPRMMQIGFRAKNRSKVDACCNAAIRTGGTDNGAPSLRPHCLADYHAAFVPDPEGHNIIAVCQKRPKT